MCRQLYLHTYFDADCVFLRRYSSTRHQPCIMGSAQRSLCCVAAAFLLLTVVTGRHVDMKDPHASGDGAPLKVDRITFSVQHKGQFRRHLLDAQPAAVPQKHESAEQVAAASSSASTDKANPAASNDAAAKPAAADTPKPAAADAPKQAPAAAAKDAKDAATEQQQKQPSLTKEAQQALLAGIAKGVAAQSKKPSEKIVQVAAVPAKVQEMTLEELLAEHAPPTSCRTAPETPGVKWNVGCADKALGASCNGIVMSGASLCNGQAGSIATIKCLPDGDWGNMQALC